MAEKLDVLAAHRHFSAECFNLAWDLMDKPTRTADEEEEMLRLGMASQWHWMQRIDCTAANLSVSYWQLSRIYVLLGQAENALRHARRCLEISRSGGVQPFYLAYAYEALARAEALAGNRAGMEEDLEQARRLAEKVEEEEERNLLLGDLGSIRWGGEE